MADPRAGAPAEPAPGSWDETRRFAARRPLEATPARRLAWLEEMLEIAESSGALARARARRDEERTQRSGGR